MSILILNSVSHARSPYEQFLKELGEDLILLTAEQHKDAFPKEEYTYIESFENYDNNDAIVIRALELYEQYPYTQVVSCYEYDVMRAATIRETLGLSGGQNLTSAQMYRDKLLMKDMVQKNRIPTPAYQSITTPQELVQFISKHGYPVVIKPISGAGSLNTFMLKSQKDLTAFLTKGMPSDLMVEAYVEGDVYHVDGMVMDGRIQFACTSKYLDALMQYRDGTYTGGYLLHPKHSLSMRMVEVTKQVIEALDTPENTAIHAEFFHTPQDEIIFCEIASRTGGGRINETLIHTFGVDLFHAHVRSQFGLPTSLPLSQSYDHVDQLSGRVLILKKEGKFVKAPSEAPPAWVIQHELHAKPGDVVNDPGYCTDLLAGFVVKGNTEEDVHNKLLSITDWFDASTQWE